MSASYTCDLCGRPIHDVVFAQITVRIADDIDHDGWSGSPHADVHTECLRSIDAAIALLRDHTADLESIPVAKPWEMEDLRPNTAPRKRLHALLMELDLGIHASRAVLNAAETLEGLKNMTDGDLRVLPGVGEKSIRKIRGWINSEVAHA